MKDSPLADRAFQVLMIASTAGFSWLAMMVVHELGHVINALMSGGVISQVVLHPLNFSRTDFASNPHPLFVAWGGAIWGCLIPWDLSRLLISLYGVMNTYSHFGPVSVVSPMVHISQAGSFFKTASQKRMMRALYCKMEVLGGNYLHSDSLSFLWDYGCGTVLDRISDLGKPKEMLIAKPPLESHWLCL